MNPSSTHLSANPRFDSFYYTGNPPNSDNFDPRASILIKARHHHYLTIAVNGGSVTNVLGPISNLPLPPVQVVNIKLTQLLIPQVCENYINDMLSQIEIPRIEIPLSTIEELKQLISTYASERALLCRERRARHLAIVVDIDVELEEYFGEDCFLEDDIDTDIEELEAQLEAIAMDFVGGFTLNPASQSAIKALEIKKFDNTMEESSSSAATETCTICMDEFVSGVNITQLPCSHSFHSECIFKWLGNKNSCPVCRFAMPTEN